MTTKIVATVLCATLVSFAASALEDSSRPAPGRNPGNRPDPSKLLEIYEARVFKDAAGKTLNYRLLKPLNLDPEKKYPLVLFLHGKGASQGQDNKGQITAPGVLPAVSLFADAQTRARMWTYNPSVHHTPITLIRLRPPRSATKICDHCWAVELGGPAINFIFYVTSARVLGNRFRK